MTHYWTADDHPAIRQAQIEDWLEDFAEFDPDIVWQACIEWRRAWTRRPTPAELRGLAAQIQQRKRDLRSTAMALPAPPRSKKPATWDANYPDRYDEEWFRNLPAERQRRYKTQDIVRAAARGEVEAGRMTAAAFVALCKAQFSGNIAGSPLAGGINGISQVHQALGIAATEREEPQ